MPRYLPGNRIFHSGIGRRSRRQIGIAAVLFFACAGAATEAAAAVSMPAIFGDHMVLQEGVALPVWGSAAPGEAVKVTVGGREGRAVADAGGAWMVKLDPLPSGGQPVDVEVQGTNTLVFHDVLVGDVWICSGQSNMELGVGEAHNASEAIPKADRPQLRLFVVSKARPLAPAADCGGKWVVCTPETVKAGRWNGFSAVGYFFGSEIQEDRKIPVGLIGIYWGGTPAQAWTDLETLQDSSALKHYADAFLKVRDNLPQLKDEYEARIVPAWRQAHDAWQQQYGAPYEEAARQWKDQSDEAQKNGLPPPRKPAPEKPEPRQPVFAGEDLSLPTALFNGMVNPVIPYGIKGVVWYQGESNCDSEAMAREYATLFPAMISGWRRGWGAEIPALARFPFLYVQLPGFYGPGGIRPYLRAAQAKALALPNTGMAVTIDIGELEEIHPKDKLDVGHRLALVARRLVYGEEVVSSGPVYDSMRVEGNQARISFKTGADAGDLIIGAAPPIRLNQAPSAPAEALQGFVVAGADGKFVAAQARIDGDDVVVWSDRVAQPVAVRYDWDGFPQPAGNLYNKEGLPAAPFATDVAF